MSYQVLARKWRPQVFSELVGQKHVVDAISNALENNKLHHAYLFTGTRGVGKTTIARIFSKSLNCEQGQSANPCGKCDTCIDISDGRYVDLLEIDAASRTKVEDTRELLDNVQYRPTRGKYKVYLIDEVHMLSKHSFNALLKTLEEPPEHVKFLLATTDPQKLPVTILSRCLQFSLKALTKEQIQAHLARILELEQIPFEDSALTQLARAAQGSIRDSLSLTDQAIAQGNNKVSLATVANMLGLLNKNHILKLIKHICERDNEAALNQIEEICSQSPDYMQVLSQLLGTLHQIALTQVVPEVCKLEGDSAKGIYTLAKALSKEHVQLLYQIGINGKRDLPAAPDARMGLEMTILRMLAFSPMQQVDLDVNTLISDGSDLPAFDEIKSPSTKDSNSSSNIPQKGLATKTDAQEPQEPQEPQEHQGSQQAKASQESQQHIGEKQEPFPPAANEQHTETQQPVTREAYEQPNERVSNSQDVEHESTRKKELIDNESTVNAYEDPPFPTEEPPYQEHSIGMNDDFFGMPPDDISSVSKKHEDIANSLPEQTHEEQSQARPPEDKVQLSNTLELLRASKSLGKDEQAEGDPAGKKSETEPATVEGSTAQVAFQFGHQFEKFNADIPAFLDNGEKLMFAAQLDEWSAFVDSTNIQALTRQLLIHANCEKLSNPLQLSLSENDKHLCEDAIIKKVEATLSDIFNETIEVSIKFGEVENTPFQIQTKINEMRFEYAHHLVETESTIQELIKAFDATVIRESVHAR